MSSASASTEIMREVISSKLQDDGSWRVRMVCGHVIEGFRTKGSGRTAPHRAPCPDCTKARGSGR